jgi:hypothetical protein
MVTVPSSAVVFRAGIFDFALARLGGEDTSETASCSFVSFFLGDVQPDLATVVVEITVVAGDSSLRLRFLESVWVVKTSSMSVLNGALSSDSLSELSSCSLTPLLPLWPRADVEMPLAARRVVR